MGVDNKDTFYKDPHAALMEVYNKMMERGGFPTDLYTNTIINRAMAINDAYVKLKQVNNYVAATPYIRMQMDNCICLYAGCLVDDVWKLVDHFIAGKRLNKLKDKNGKPLYELNVVKGINADIQGFKRLYEIYNAEVHLSDRHFSSSIYMNADSKLYLSLNTEQYSSDSPTYDTNLWQVNRIMVQIMLNSWLRYKESCLDIANDKDELKQLIKEKLEYYPHIRNLLKSTE